MDSEDDKFDSELCEVYQLRITIIGSKPWVWRRIHISEASELTDLGTAILKSVGWWNGANSFELQCKFLKREAEDPFFEAGSNPEAELGIDCTIRTLFEKWGNPTRFYCGNEGHNWLHLVTREKRITRDPKRIYPACIRGNNACPPEDCKNIEEYKELLKLRRNPGHPKCEAKKHVLSKLEKFNPKLFANPRYIGGTIKKVFSQKGN